MADDDDERPPRARSQVGEIFERRAPNARVMSGDQRALDGLRARDTGRMAAVRDPDDAELDDSELRRRMNLVLKVHEESVRAQSAPTASNVRSMSMRLLEGLALTVLGTALTLSVKCSVDNRADQTAMHDRQLLMEQRLEVLEREFGAVFGLRVLPSTVPGVMPGKDPIP